MVSKKRERWYRLIQEWEASNETQVDFCTRHNLSIKSFTNYRTDYLKLKSSGNKAQSSLIPVKVKPQRQVATSTEQAYEVLISTPSQYQISVKVSDVDTLLSLVKGFN